MQQYWYAVNILLDLSELVRDNIELRGPNECICLLCGYQAKKKHHIENHIEANHMEKGFKAYTCDICRSSHSTRNSLGVHKSKFHKKKGLLPF